MKGHTILAEGITNIAKAIGELLHICGICACLREFWFVQEF